MTESIFPGTTSVASGLTFVHRYVEGSSSRTLLLLHGTGGDEDDLIPLAGRLDPDAHVLSPRGKVLENGMPRFFKRTGMGVFDLEDLERQTDDLADFVENAARAYRLDRSEIVAVGYSNGANIAASMLLRRPGVLPAAILLHAMIPFLPDPIPDLASTRVLLTGGRSDPWIPAAQTQELARILEAGGADVDLAWNPGGHELTTDEVELAQQWIRELGPDRDAAVGRG